MADGKQKPIWYVVGCIGIGLILVPCVGGVIAAIAIPAFVNFTRRSKTAEARANVGAIMAGVEAYCDTEHPGSGPLPRAAGPTLSAPGAERQAQTLGPEWDDVAFSSADPLYYAYSIERPDASTAIVVAEGDLDGDGVRSRFAATCTLTPPSGCSCGEPSVTNELE